MPPQSEMKQTWDSTTSIDQPPKVQPQSTVNSQANLIDDTEADYQCGVFSYRPQWLQRFAHPRWYFINYVLMGILSGANKTYLIGILSTVERRFQMSNSTTAFILIADNVAPIFINLVAGYYANRVSRPKLMSIGSFIVVLGCFINMIPFFLYGPGVTSQLIKQTSAQDELQLCHAGFAEQKCGSNDASIVWVPFLLFFSANFLHGVGGSLYYVVGSTYMDDNIKKKNSPLYFSLTFSLRLFGPVLGFLTSSLCLTYYEDIFNGPPAGLTNKDPRWIGAWWLGYVGFSVALSFVAIPMMLFPRILPMGRDQKANKIMKKKTGSGAVKDIYLSIRRLFKNPIFTLKSVGFILIIIGTSGYGTSFSKYLEHQFGRSPSSASFLSGTSKVFTSMVGILMGGLLLQCLRPSARKTAGYVAGVETLYLCGFTILLFIGCQQAPIEGMGNHHLTGQTDRLAASLMNSCNAPCDCSPTEFNPVCAPNGVTFFSPCYAGCRQKLPALKGQPIQYTNCTCTSPMLQDVPQATVESGFCGPECTTLTLYLVIVVLCNFIGSSGRCGSLLIYLRCVDPTDKSMALGTSSSLINLIAFMPYPVIYGGILDSSCAIWGETCDGRRGSCRLYDKDKLRIRLHLVTLGFLAGAIVCYIAVIFYADRIKHFYSEPDDEEVTMEKVESAENKDSANTTPPTDTPV